MIEKLPWIYDDGGRSAAGFKGQANDCVCRAIAIATEQPYSEVYYDLRMFALTERISPLRRGLGRSHPRTHVWNSTARRYLEGLGWTFVPTMVIGSGCHVHLALGEMPEEGRYIVRLSKHLTTLVNGCIRDTYDPSRMGTRCVYGYWRKDF